MKKFRHLLLASILGIVAITTSAFAYFNFSTTSSTSSASDTKENYVNNIKFDNTSTIDRTFNLYFFASPYYATGSDTSNNEVSWSDAKSINPLDICNLGVDNPYNNTSDYTLGGMAVAKEYANAAYTTSTEGEYNYHYLCIPDDAIDTTLLKDGKYIQGTANTITKFYKTRDFTGYLTVDSGDRSFQKGTLETDSDGNYIDVEDDKIYTYCKITVKGGIKAEKLNQIIAHSVFKDRYGFGPEFMGWTYDKEACFNRTTYTNSSDSSTKLRYIKQPTNANDNTVMSHFSNNGWGISWSNLAYQIGNYGDNEEIPILSADDSLIYINSLGIDGSSKNDNNIFLYPVFGSKNMIKHQSGNQSPILKMRTNPITDTEDEDYYKYHQIGEVDYDNERFTSYFNYIPEADIDSGEPNYTLKNFHVDQVTDEDGNYVNNYQLDVNFTNSDNSWNDVWATLIDSSTLASSIDFYDDYFKTYGGYFDIDIIFVQSTTYTFSSLKHPENYINDVTRVNSATITSGSNTYDVSYIIGIKRDNTLKITGLSDQNAIFLYDGSSQQNSYLFKSELTYIDSSSSTESIWYYFTSNSIQLKENQNISTMIQNAMKYKDENHDLNSFTYMSEDRLKAYNDVLVSSSAFDNKTKYQATNETAKLTSGRKAITASDPDNVSSKTTIENFPYINATEEGTYELLIAIEYKKGFPYNIEVGYREIATDNVLLVLNTLPTATSNGYLYSEIYETYSSYIVCEGTFQNNTIITTSTLFQNDKSITIDDNSKIIDLATGIDVTNLIKNNKFYSNRNMILYYKN